MITKTINLYKTSFTGLSKETWLLSFIMLVNRSGTMVVPFMTLYLTSKQMNHSLSEAGFVMSLFGLGSIIGAYFGGKLTDKIGFYKVQLFALFFGGLLFIALGQVKSYSVICLITFLLSLINESFRPANSSAIAHYSNTENRTRSYSLNRLAINLGWSAGASVGGFIASVNYEWLFWIDGISNIVAAFVLFYSIRPVLNFNKKTEQPSKSTIKSAYKDRIYLWYIVLIVLFGFCFFQLFTTIPKYFRDNLHLDESFIGLLMAINGIIIVALEMVVVYSLEKQNKNLYYMFIGTLICALSYFTLLIPGSAVWISLLMIVLISFGEILSMPFMNTFWVNRSTESNRGQYAALFTMAWGVAQVIGAFTCSALVDATNFNMMFILLGFLLIVTAFGFLKIRKMTTKEI